MVQPWLPMAYPNANICEYVFITLFPKVAELVCRLAINDVGIPKECSHPDMGIVKPVEKGIYSVTIIGLGFTG